MSLAKVFQNKYGLLAVVASSALILDQWTKWMIHSHFRGWENL